MEAKKDQRNTGQSHTISYLRETEEALIVSFEEKIRRTKIKAHKPIKSTEGILFLQYWRHLEGACVWNSFLTQGQPNVFLAPWLSRTLVWWLETIYGFYRRFAAISASSWSSNKTIHHGWKYTRYTSLQSCIQWTRKFAIYLNVKPNLTKQNQRISITHR